MKKLCITLTILFSFAALSGCVARHHDDRGSGSVSTHIIIPLAPAHGYRHHHDGVTLIFDAGLGVYVVAGHPGMYFYNGRYFSRHARGHWIYGSHFRGPWQNYVSDGRVPRGFSNHIKERRDARKDHREDKGDAHKDRREDKGDARKDRREDKGDARKDRREDKGDARKDRREDRGDARKDRRNH